MEVGLLNQVIRIKKVGRSLLLNLGGITVNTFFAFVEIYRFVKTYMQSIQDYLTNFTIQTSTESYEQFIKDIDYVQRIYPEYDDETRERVRRIIDGNSQSTDQHAMNGGHRAYQSSDFAGRGGMQ